MPGKIEKFLLHKQGRLRLLLIKGLGSNLIAMAEPSDGLQPSNEAIVDSDESAAGVCPPSGDIRTAVAKSACSLCKACWLRVLCVAFLAGTGHRVRFNQLVTSSCYLVDSIVSMQRGSPLLTPEIYLSSVLLCQIQRSVLNVGPRLCRRGYSLGTQSQS